MHHSFGFGRSKTLSERSNHLSKAAGGHIIAFESYDDAYQSGWLDTDIRELISACLYFSVSSKVCASDPKCFVDINRIWHE
jgi:hypothetical protein